MSFRLLLLFVFLMVRPVFGQVTNPPTVDAELSTVEYDVEGLRSGDDDETTVGRLIQIDEDLRKQHGASTARLGRRVLEVLAEKRTTAAIEHLRSVFETQTMRRHDAAYAISLAAMRNPTSEQDWRFLVRSLTIVEGEQAVSVLNALRRFRRRATKPVWVREVILLGLRLPAEEQGCAIELLDFWTQRSSRANATAGERLAEYQSWFRESYAHEPVPELPVDPPNATWTWDKTSGLLPDLLNSPDSRLHGQLAYAKGNCNKCHRLGDMPKQPTDDRLGPDLNSLGWRRQPREIVMAILYPSHHLNDDYPVTTVVLKNGTTFTGLMVPDGDEHLTISGSDGRQTRVARSEIEEYLPSSVSVMPAGLLEPLTRDEVQALLWLLSAQSGKADRHSSK